MHISARNAFYFGSNYFNVFYKVGQEKSKFASQSNTHTYNSCRV